jgi:hypothetical protein
MIPAAFGRTVIAFSLGLLAAMPPLAAESLPMPVAHYAALCQHTGGSMMRQLTGGVGIVQCKWPGHGRTQCKVGADQVSICGITCESNACLKENPARFTPIWPLQGGPNGAAAPTN